jgi:hypothetical protein
MSLHETLLVGTTRRQNSKHNRMLNINRILRSPDGEASLGALDVDLSSVDTSFPLLAEGMYDLEVKAMEQKKTKDEQGDMIVATFVTTREGRSTKGAPINPGFPIFYRLNLTPKGEMTEAMILRNLAKFREGVTGSKSGSFGPIEQYVGKVVRAKVVVRVDKTGNFGDVNDIKSFVNEK